MLEKIPHGIDEIISVYGDLDDPDFEYVNIVSFMLPYPLIFSRQLVRKTRCHKLAVDHFIAALSKIKELGLETIIVNYGGIYNRRSKRLSSRPSTHSWGIAVDLEPELYPLGSIRRFPDSVVNVFNDAGFLYGGDFKGRKDPMHFQLCTGY